MIITFCFPKMRKFEQFTKFYKIIAVELPELGISIEQAEEIAKFKVADTSNYIFFEKSKETILKLKKTIS